MMMSYLFLSVLLIQPTTGWPQRASPTTSPVFLSPATPAETDLAIFLSELEKATEGLTYMSEQDHPLRPFVWKEGDGPLTSEMVLRLSGHAPDEPVETIDFDWFFHNAVRDEIYGAEAASRFRKLKHLLKSNLKDVQVFRVGRISLDVYVVGRKSDRTFVGLQTKVVET